MQENIRTQAIKHIKTANTKTQVKILQLEGAKGKQPAKKMRQQK